MSNHYETLGVSEDVTADELKRAYKQLAIKWHPDKNSDDPNAEKRFKEINEAYQTLSDPEKRSLYDMTRKNPSMHGFGFGDHGFPDIGFPGGFDGRASDIFEELFARDRRRYRKKNGPVRGSDIEIPLKITLLESVQGCDKEITYDVRELCDGCGGKGYDGSSGPHKCAACNGKGARQEVKGPVMFTITCNACMGSGELPGNACAVCRGSGRRNVTKKARVKLPSGIDRGNVLRHAGHGEPGVRGGQPGDLFVVVGIEPHAFYERDGADLYTHAAEATFTTCILGGSMDIKLLDGTQKKAKIPPGTKPGSTVMLHGEGVPDVNDGTKGDLYVEVGLKLPTEVSKHAKDLLVELDEELFSSGSVSS